MTDQQIIDYYANLLIVQYRGKAKAYATAQALVTPLVMNQLPIAVQNAFNLNTAVGVQLDVIAKYTGVSRKGNGFSGPVTLVDSDLRSLIKFAILKNNSGSSLYDIQLLISIYFAGKILIFDEANMQMGYFLDSSIGSISLAQVVVTSGLLPKPMGVQLASTVYSANISSFFGFRTYDLAGVNNSPLNNYDTYTMTWPWLNYDNALS